MSRSDAALIYRRPIPRELVSRELDRLLGGRIGNTRIFFRADDAGIPSANWDELARLFLSRSIPLNIALVPAWLTQDRWRILSKTACRAGELFCWHQHGFRHQNHEPRGKYQEFGPSRPKPDLASDLEKGRDRLGRILGNRFFPGFTPPWNRCDDRTLDLLRGMGYLALSRDAGASPGASIPEFPVHMDLHTRKDKNGGAGLTAVFQSMDQGLETGCCGIMIHHRFMNRTAFEFLAQVLDRVCSTPGLDPVTFKVLTDYG